MKIIPLYKTVRADGGVSISPNGSGTPHAYRLVADDGMLLKKGDTITPCVDTDCADGWTEIIDMENMDTEDMRTALALLGVE